MFSLSMQLNDLSGPIPPELSKFKRLRDLFLDVNPNISGRLPPELGFTGGLRYLGVSRTSLTGPVPRTFANLELIRFYFDRDGVCIPADLEAWLQTVPEREDGYSICTYQITVDPPTLYFEAPPLGDTARLKAAVITAEGDMVHDANISWSSADAAIATVDSTGLVTAVDYGTTQVTATSDALTATAEVEVVLTLTDRQVLDSIHQLLGGENWTDTTNWLTDEPLSEWYGVETNDAGKVVGLSLATNGLAGPTPDVLAELGDLVTLDLSGNALAGEIPSGLGALRQLQSLVLNDNALEGRLHPDLGRVAALRFLNIGSNNMVGVVPRTFANLALDTLYTADSGVCVPPSLDEWFAGIGQTDEADRCAASLAIAIVDLPSPTFYAIGETGTLSATYVNAEGDSTHEASVTWSSGDASVVSVDSRGRVTAVGAGTAEVTATHDSVTASIAVEVALPENDRDVLETLYDRTRGNGWTKATNWLSDEPLAEWAGVETDESGRVTGLSLSGNNLRGTIHPSIGQLDRLVTLDLSRNWITGSIPAEMGELSRLLNLILSVNALTGTLPPELGALDSLRALNVVVTSLSGRVPPSFAGLELDSFHAGGTELCLPPSLATWHAAIAQSDTPPDCAALVSVKPSSLTFAAVGDTARLSVTIIDAEGNAVESPAVTWETDDVTVAMVDATGLVTGRANGITTVTATYDSATVGGAEVAVRLSGSDRAALAALYHATGGDQWKDNTNWLTDEPLEEWHGVRVRSGRVDELELRNNDLNGQIPAAIGLLESLFILDLSNNAITGPIPPAIGRLQRLRDLNLRDTGLENPVPPEIGNMNGLSYLSLTNTNLSGPLPETFANLNVERFYHSGTGLCVPRSLAAWYETLGNTDPLPCIPETADREVLVALHDATDGPGWQDRYNWMTDKGVNTWEGIATDEEGYVTEIFLPWNKLTGSIPPELGDLARLEVLALYGNDLEGPIPPELGKLDRVRILLLSSNELEGPIPPEIGGMVSVDTMFLSGNDLSGPIPPEFGNLVNLEHLSLFENDLSGPLPAEFGKLKRLKSMWMVDNQFEGPLPPELGDMTSLEDLSLSRNKITGSLPPELGNLQNLKELGLNDNELTGPVPPELGNMSSLEGMYLMRNQLSGSIPAELGKLSNLETMWIFDNEFTGPIPAELR
ncbi:MAG: Ig-like domain-containing protein [Gemmatimonadetes bacterium]|nr:Ig-like domain-containing protein [Gemmatimonadota bacterium]